MDKVKEILELTQKMKSSTSGFDFLLFLDLYVETIQQSDYLKKVLILIQDCYEKESIKLLKISNDSDFDSFIVREELQPEVEEKYPINMWRRLLEAQKRFQLIKHYGSEENIPDLTILLPVKWGQGQYYL